MREADPDSEQPAQRYRAHQTASQRKEPGNERTAYVPPAPVGQQAPPMRAAAFDLWQSLRSAHGPLLLTTGTAATTLTYPQEIDTQDSCTYWCLHALLGMAGMTRSGCRE